VLDSILDADQSLSTAAQSLRSPVLDVILSAISSPWALFAVLPLVAWWVWRKRRAAIVVLLLVGVAVGLSDAITGLVMKPAFARTRPNGTRLSFPSSHASNTTAAAVVLAFEIPPIAVPALAGAAVVSCARVIEGKHWPSDVVVGGAIGAAVAGAVELVRKRLARRTSPPAAATP